MLFRLPLLKCVTIRHTKLIAVFFTLLAASLCWLTIKRSDRPRVSQADTRDLCELALDTSTGPGTAATVLHEGAPAKATRPALNNAYGKLPLQFEPNEGQAAPDVAFITRGSGYTLFLKQAEAVLSVREQDLRLKLLDGNPAARISALDALPGKMNHFKGNDAAKWRTNISTYKKVKYESVYPGVDLIYYGDQGRLEYDFIVAPGTDPHLIQLSFPEAKELHIDRAGALIVKVQGVELRQPKPLVYQETATGRRIVGGNYILKDRKSFAFQIGDYDRNEPLIIDPTLTYSTLLGTTKANSIAVDDAGNAYITGQIDSDVYVLKLNPTGTALIYSALIGGTSDDEGAALALDSGGNVYVTGATLSTDFPMVNAMQSSHGANNVTDAFVFKLNPSGSALTYSTYLGGDGFDSANAIAVNSSGNAFVAGTTDSTNFPVANALQPATAGGGDVFISKFSPTGNTLVYSTYLGGGDFDVASGAALDSADNFYVTGTTFSSDFPTTVNARQPVLAGSLDTFISKINSSGNALLYSTYHGGSNVEFGDSIAVDSAGNIYVAGRTHSKNFPVANALKPTMNENDLADAFVTKFNSEGNGIIYSTYLGGSSTELPSGLAVDPGGSVYITGRTSSFDFPLFQPLQKSVAGFDDVYIAKINPAGSALTFSTYLGGSGLDIGQKIVVRNGSIFVIGRTETSDFPTTPGAFRQNHFEEDGSVEGFAVRIDSATNTNYYSISGRVTTGITGMSGILVTLSGSTSRTVRTDFDGTYSFYVLAEGGSYTVTATPPQGFSFSPSSRTFANLNADQTGADFGVPRPPNDDFSNAQVISDISGVITGNNAGATVEFDEMQGGFASVWYRWQAPGASSVVLNVDKPGLSLQVFTGSSINALTSVGAQIAACDFCTPSGVSLKAIAGTVYIIRIASSGGTPGAFGFSFSTGVSISGQVRNVNGRSLSGLPIKVNLLDRNLISTTVTTDTGYSIVVAAGGNYSVVANSPFVTSFVPVQLNNLNQDVMNVDFIASSPTLSISGKLHGLAVPLNQVAVNVTGIGIEPKACVLVLTDQGLSISYSCGPLPILGDYRIVPSTADYVFDPLERVFPQLLGNVDSTDFLGRLRSVPAVATFFATAITPTSATLNGSVTPLGSATNAWFEWGTSPGLETSTSTTPQAVGAGAAPVPVSSELSGLTPGTTYFFRAVAMNSAGTSRGSIQSFRAPLVPVQVTFQTNPAGRAVFVDGSQIRSTNTPQVVQWEPGSSHTISTHLIEAGLPGTQYVWNSWSDDGAVSHVVIAPATNTTYTANFTTQHQLTMVAGSGGTVSPSSGFFNSGQSVQITATPNSGFSFTGWTGAGSGSFNGSANPATVTMNGPITQTAGFKTALRLMVESNGPVPDLLLALDAALMLRDPFAVINPLSFLSNSSDKNTRLIIFLQSFQPVAGELPSAVVVNLVGSNNQNFDVPAADVRPLANTDLVQVTFRLPDNLASGNCVVKVKAHGEITNSATLRISP